MRMNSLEWTDTGACSYDAPGTLLLAGASPGDAHPATARNRFDSLLHNVKEY